MSVVSRLAMKQCVLGGTGLVRVSLQNFGTIEWNECACANICVGTSTRST
jgi:hypothetical protein